MLFRFFPSRLQFPKMALRFAASCFFFFFFFFFFLLLFLFSSFSLCFHWTCFLLPSSFFLLPSSFFFLHSLLLFLLSSINYGFYFFVLAAATSLWLSLALFGRTHLPLSLSARNVSIGTGISDRSCTWSPRPVTKSINRDPGIKQLTLNYINH